MYWIVQCDPGEEPADFGPDDADGRYVLHRHRDSGGPHLDLRLEQDGHLGGWRIDSTRLEGESWATEKAPHPIVWLQRDGDAVREVSGWYRLATHGGDERVILLRGKSGARVIHVTRAPALPPAALHSVLEALREHGGAPQDAGRLVADGLIARRRAVERLCGLARELDGGAFDEGVCRKSLQSLSLDEIHTQLRAYELRFDRKYPPAAVSRPEPLPERVCDLRRGEAMAIVRGSGIRGRGSGSKDWGLGGNGECDVRA